MKAKALGFCFFICYTQYDGTLLRLYTRPIKVGGFMRFNTRQIAVVGLLGAITMVLGSTSLGFIPIPFSPAGRATIMHIPVILAAILEGPVVGMLVGLIFGMFSFMQQGSPLFADPLIAIAPRVLIGLTSYLVFIPLARLKKKALGSVVAAVVGTLTNTVGVLGLALLRGFLPDWRVAGMVVVTHGFPEVVVAAVLIFFIYKAVNRYMESSR